MDGSDRGFTILRPGREGVICAGHDVNVQVVRLGLPVGVHAGELLVVDVLCNVAVGRAPPWPQLLSHEMPPAAL